MLKLSLLSIAFAFTIACLAQSSTDVYLFKVSNEVLSNPINISYNEGYNNQPSFWPDNKSVLYARTINGQTEIARYFIDTEETTIITSTLQGSEYSPIPIPGTSNISSIRLDTTGLQLLYRYELDGNFEVLVKDLKIGYHAWISNTEIVTFVLGNPATMQIINIVTGDARIVADSIGRSLHKIPNTTDFSFLDKSSAWWIIKSMNPTTNKMEEIIGVTEGSEDYCWTPDGKLLMGKGDTIYILNDVEGWLPLWNLNLLFGIEGSITRLTVSPDGNKLAIVVGN